MTNDNDATDPWDGVERRGEDGLLTATESVGAVLKGIREDLGGVKELQEKQRKQQLVTWVFSALVLALGGWLWIQNAEINSNQVTNCQNANETRGGQRALWDFIVDVSVQSNPDATPAVQQFYTDLQVYIHDLFANRDCSNLDKEYVLPDPPRIPLPKDIKEEKG